MGKQKRNVPKQASKQNDSVKPVQQASFADILVHITEMQKLVQLLKEIHTLDREWDILLSLLDEVDKLLPKQQKSKDIVAPTAESMAKLEEWLRARGVESAGRDWSIQNMGEMGFGLVANKQFKEGDDILKISNDLMLSTCQMDQSQASELLSSSPFYSHFPTVTLACMLLCELQQGDSSRFHPYICSLPTSFSIPLCMTRPELQLLRRSVGQRAVVSSIAAAISHYCFVVGSLQLLKSRNANTGIDPDLSFSDFRWALAIVTTRQNPHPHSIEPADKDRECLALIPAFDMVNHEYGNDTAGFDDSLEVLTLRAKRDFDTGSQIFMSYGHTKDATDFMVHSGFVPPEFAPSTSATETPAPHSVAPAVVRPCKISLVLLLSSVADPIHKARLSLLKNIGLIPTKTVDLPSESKPATTFVTKILGTPANLEQPGAYFRIAFSPDSPKQLLTLGSMAVLTKEEILAAMRNVSATSAATSSLASLFGVSVVQRAEAYVQEHVCDDALAKFCDPTSYPLASNPLRLSVRRLRVSEHASLSLPIRAGDQC